MATKLGDRAAQTLVDLAKAGKIEYDEVRDLDGNVVEDQILIRGVGVKEVKAAADKPRKRGDTSGKPYKSAI